MPHSTAEFVFLHGLTFDRHMWDTAVAGLPTGARALAVDLPGHGHAPALARHHVEDVVEAVHAAVQAAGMDAPILVGHSVGGLLATVYAARHPVAAVVNVDQPLAPPAPFLQGVQQFEAQLRGPAFPQVWAMFQASMHMELVPPAGRDLLQAGEHAAQDVVLSYWHEVFTQTVADVAGLLDDVLMAVRDSGVPVVAMYGNPIGPEVRAWVEERLPAAEIVVWPVGHHFPHLAHPERFAALLRGVAAAVGSAGPALSRAGGR